VGGGQVDQAAFAEDVDASAVGQDVLINELADAFVQGRGGGELVDYATGNGLTKRPGRSRNLSAIAEGCQSSGLDLREPAQ
jgi:hypothetical protein